MHVACNACSSCGSNVSIQTEGPGAPVAVLQCHLRSLVCIILEGPGAPVAVLPVSSEVISLYYSRFISTSETDCKSECTVCRTGSTVDAGTINLAETAAVLCRIVAFRGSCRWSAICMHAAWCVYSSNVWCGVVWIGVMGTVGAVVPTHSARGAGYSKPAGEPAG